MMRSAIFLAVSVFVFFGVAHARADEPLWIPLIFVTDIGNDRDDIVALGMILALQDRQACELLAVTITKDHDLVAPFVDAVNAFYGRGDIPIGVGRSGVTPEPDKYNVLANDQSKYPHDFWSGIDVLDAVDLLRKTLASAVDGSVAIVQVGFSTNLATLLTSKPDSLGDLGAVDLVRKKVKLLSVMSGAFQKRPSKQGGMIDHRECNVIKDIPAAKTIASEWPTDTVWSGFAIGLAIPYPSKSILKDFNDVPHQPLAEAYIRHQPPPHDRPTWDLTSVLYAVRPDHACFDVSPVGDAKVEENGLTTFAENPKGKSRFLILQEKNKGRITEALTLLSSHPPKSH